MGYLRRKQVTQNNRMMRTARLYEWFSLGVTKYSRCQMWFGREGETHTLRLCEHIEKMQDRKVTKNMYCMRMRMKNRMNEGDNQWDGQPGWKSTSHVEKVLYVIGRGGLDCLKRECCTWKAGETTALAGSLGIFKGKWKVCYIAKEINL